MGIDISSKLLLVPTDQKRLFELIQAKADEEFDGDFHYVLDSLGFDYASPWYDASLEYCDVGIQMPVATYSDLIDSESKWFDCLHTAQTKIDSLMGWETPTKLSSFQHVY